jgi:hypothetical protein
MVSFSGIRGIARPWTTGPPASRQPGEQLYRDLVASYELRKNLFGRTEIHELRLGAVEPDLARCRVDNVERNKPGQPSPTLRLDHQMGDGVGGGVDDHTPHLAAEPIAAASVTADHERYLCQ